MHFICLELGGIILFALHLIDFLVKLQLTAHN